MYSRKKVVKIKVIIVHKRRQLYKVASLYKVTYKLICNKKNFTLFIRLENRNYFYLSFNKNNVNILIWYCSVMKKRERLTLGLHFLNRFNTVKYQADHDVILVGYEAEIE